MSHHRRRQPPSFWELWREYLLSELRAIALMLAACGVLIFLVASLLLGMYQLVRSFLLLLLPF